MLHKYSDDKLTYKGSEIKNPDSTDLERFSVAYKNTSLTKHSTLKEYYSVFGKDLESLYKFSTIRNPWDRCISYYFSPHRGQVEWDKNSFIKFISKNVSPMRDFLGLTEDDDFVVNIDHIMKFENLSKQFHEVTELLNIEQAILPHKNKSKKSIIRIITTKNSLTLYKKSFTRI